MIIATAVRGLIGYNGHTLPPETLEHPLSSFAQYVLSLLGFGVFLGCLVFSKSAQRALPLPSSPSFIVRAQSLFEVSLD
jgi:hypothetical protein